MQRVLGRFSALLFAAVPAILIASIPGTALAATSTISATPIANAPYTPATGQTPQKLKQCGNTMYVVGTTTVAGAPGQTTVSRANMFSFDLTTKVISSWNPNVNGLVNDIAFSPDCTAAYIGGSFTTVGGVAAKNIAKISTQTGVLDLTFAHSAPAKVYALAYYNGHLLTGGYFTSINGGASSYLTSLNPTTGKIDGYLNLPISGTYPQDVTHIWSFSNIVGGRMLVNGVFTSVAGQQRQQVFMVDLGATSVTLDAWYSPIFNQFCAPSSEKFSAKGIAMSPDGNFVGVFSTGYRGATLCDSAAKFSSASNGNQQPLWINYTGGDSLYAGVFEANGNVIVGGHQRWLNNPNGLDSCGAGCLSRPGIGEIDGTTGLATGWNPGKTRGHGVTSLFIASDHTLWITSDTNTSSNLCGGKYHPGICAFAGA